MHGVRFDPQSSSSSRSQGHHVRGDVPVPRHGEHATLGQVVEVILEGLHRVEAVLDQRQGARGLGRGRVDLGELDQVEALGALGHVAPAVAHGERHPRQVLGTAAEVAEIVAHEGDDQRVDLHGMHPFDAEELGGQDVGTAARADDQCAPEGSGARPGGGDARRRPVIRYPRST